MSARVYPAVESTQPAPYGMADSLGVLRHQWWAVVLATLLGIAAAGGWAQTREPVWESTTSVLVHPAGQDTNVVGGRTQGQVNLDTEAQLVRSTAVAAGAAELLAPAPTGPDELAQRTRVDVPPNTSVLMITFSDATPEEAQAGARAFATAYLQHRERAARADLAAQMETIETKVKELDASLREINERLATAPPGTTAEANLVSQHGTVTNQLNVMTSRHDELATATVASGTVISEARLPSRPSQPQPGMVLASGAAVGLVVGVGAAGLAERLARRVRRPADLSRRLGLPVLAVLSAATAPRRDEIASPYGPAGRAFDRLRNEVVASERVADAGDGAGRAAGGWVILVTSSSGGAAASVTAANLAASLSRSGHEVALVGARVPDAGGGALTRLLGVAPTPGLSEVLAGRVPISEALQRSPRHPRMKVITMGATATATGLLQSPPLRATLAMLAGQARYVVVDAPPTCVSADAQSLASHADAALLVVERRRARLADVADAVDQLRRVGTPLLGAVLVPPLPAEEDAPLPPMAGTGTPSSGNGSKPAPRLGAKHEQRDSLADDSAAGDGQTVVLPRADGKLR